MKRFLQADLGRKTERVGVALRQAVGVGTVAAYVLALPIDAARAGGQPVLPSGGVVSAGGATIVQPNATTLNVDQSTARAIINWNSFSVGRGDTVNFNQPGASSATLNRVTGSTPSWVGGAINAPGTVLLVNPNGIEIARSGTVNTGAFAASTLGIKDSDFLSGNYAFTGNGASAAVVNNGRINVADGGFAALLGGQVANNGIISARLGSVGLGAGEQATLDLSGDGFLSVAVPSSEMGNLVDPNGALVSSKGKIVANGGTVFLSAATAANILKNAVNIPGEVRTNTVGTHNGKIVINGGDGGAVSVSGRLVANGGKRRRAGSIAIAGRTINVSGKLAANGASGGAISLVGGSQLALSGKLTATGKSGQGGEIDLTAANVALTGAGVDASGATGGGDINIGGGPHATVALADAQSVSIDDASVISANATNNGDGGRIVVWSDGLTTALGSFTAEGGPNGGNGGFVETSGENLDMNGVVNASAANGLAGTWLLDPNNVTIVGAAGNSTSNPGYSPNWTAGSGGGNINVSDINTSLNAGTNVTITASGMIEDAYGASISKTSGGDATLTMNAGQDIIIAGSTITSTAGKLNLSLNADTANGGGAVLIENSSSIETNGGNISLSGVGDSSHAAGVEISGATIGAQGGNITVAGIGYGGAASNNYGVDLQNSGFLQTSGTGTISVSGTGGGNGGSSNYGVTVTGSAITNAGTGATSVTGVGGDNGASSSSSDDGVYVSNSGAISNTGGSLTIAGTAGGSGVASASSNFGIANIATTIGGASSAGPITLVADNYNVYAGSTLAQTTGNVTFLALTPGTTIGVAGGAGTLQVTSTLLGEVKASSFTIGSTSGSADITVGSTTSGAMTWGEPVSLLNGAGNVNINSAQKAGSYSFLADTASGNITIGSSGSVTSSASGDAITLAASGGDFTNNAGANALKASNGNWLVYSNSPTSDTFGNLNSGNTAVWGASYPTAVSATGNRYVFAGDAFVTVTPADATKVYGATETFTGETYTATVSGDAETGVTNAFVGFGSPAFSGTAVFASDGAAASAGVGSYGITVSGLIVANGYSLLLFPGALSIIPAPLTITADSSSKTYGQTVTFAGTEFSSNGLQNNETIGSVTLASPGAAATAPAIGSPYTVSISNASGGTFNASNYSISYVPGLLTVNKAPLAITANDQTMTYGSAGNSLVAGVIPSGLVNGDSVTGATLATNATVSSTSGLWNAGNWTITPSAVIGSGLSNYAITYQAGALDIAAKAITISAVSGNMTYDGSAESSLTPTAPGLVSGDKVLNLSESYNSPNVLSANTLSVNSGYTISDGNNGSNYAVKLATASGSIRPASVTLTGKKTYDGGTAFAAADFGAGGVISTGIGLQTLAVTGSGSVMSPNVIAGAQTLKTGALALASGGSGLTSGLASNYAIASTGNTGDITAATIALAGTKVYNGNTTFTAADFGADGTINTGVDDQTLKVTGSGQVSSPNVSAGTQSLNPAGLGLANNGNNLASNYQISTLSNTGAITPATLTYIANAASMTYGGAAPALSGTVTGFVNGQKIGAVTTGTLAFNTMATSASSVGSYAITGSGLTADDGNYVFRQAAANATAFTVNKALLTITAYDEDLTYGGATNVLSEGVLVTGLVTANGDSVTSETLKTNANVSSTSGFWNAGDWTITPSAAKGSGLSNYAITYQTGALDIAAKALTISAVSGSMTYDGSADSNLTPTVAGLVAGDKVFDLSESYNSPNVLSANTLSVNSGYALSDGNNGKNYVVKFATASGSITPAPVMLTGTKVYDGGTTFIVDDFGSNGTVFTGVGLQTLTVTGGSGSAKSPNVTANPQTLSTGTLALADGNGFLGGLASNYVIAPTGNTGIVTPATIALAGTKVYDGNTTFTAADFGSDGVINTGVNGETLDVTGGGFVLSSNVSAGTQFLVPSGLGLANASGLASNYKISLLGDTGVITPATLTYVATANGTTYGGAVPSLSGTVTGFVGKDTLANATSGAALWSTNASSMSNVGGYDIDGGGLTADHGNYKFVQASTNAMAFTVSPALLTVSGDKVYDATTDFAATQLAVTGGVTGETVSLTSGAGTTSSANAGVYAGATLSGLVLSVSGGNGLASNYSLPTTGLLTINQEPVTITAASNTKTYDGTASAVNAPTVSGALYNVDGAAVSESYATVNAGTGLTLNPSATFSGPNGGNNYAITYVANTSGVINQAPLTVGGAKVYDSTTGFLLSQLSVTGGVTGETVSLTSGTGTTSSADAGGYAGSTLSGLAISVAGSNTLASNYSLPATGLLTINQEPVTITAASNTKTYDGTGSAANAPTVSGALYNVDGALLSESYATVNAGTGLTLNPSATFSGPNGGNNYAITYVANTSGVISPALLTYVAAANGMIYGAAVPGLSGAVTGFVNNQNLASATSGSLAFGTLAGSTSNVGNYAITGSGLTANSGNYTFAQAAANSTAFTVSPATLTYVAAANGMIYGAAVPGLSGAVTGFVNNQNLASATSGSLAFGTLAGSTSNVGNYAITGSGLTANSGNYTFAQAAANSTAFTVSPATLTYVAAANGMIYGAAVPGLSGAVTGFVNNQNLASATSGSLAFGTLAGSTSNVGSYAITGSGLTANSGNYTFAQAAANSTAFTVSPATLTYVAAANGMIYGAAVPGLSGAVTGFVNNQNLASATSGSLAFGTLAGSTSNVGNYAITGSGLTANSGNYTFAQAAANSTAFTVSPATLTYVAAANGMIYGAAVPGLSGAVIGFVNNQNLASATSGSLAFGTLAGSTSNVGSYAITGSGLTANSGNYTFAQAAANSTAFTVSPATLTYVAAANGMIYGAAAPGLSGAVTGFVNGQDLASATSGSLAFGTLAGSTSNVGSYAITGSGLTANNGNYTFQQAAGNASAFSVNPATLTYTANSYVEPAAAAFPTFAGAVTGFVNGQDLASATTGAAAFTTSATPVSPLGTYAIDGSGLTANNGNYVFAQAASNATALTLQQSQSDAPSQVSASTNGATTTPTNVNFSFLSPTPIANVAFSLNTGSPAGPIHVAFTPDRPANATAQNGANVYPAALPPGQAYTHNHGLDFEPISQYDANQYSHFQLPDFADRDGAAAIFTILARAVSRGHGGDYLIDGFWSGAGPTWSPSAPNVKPPGKVIFSDGAGHTATPTAEAAFPIVPGHTDMALLLKNGPVMLVGPTSQRPAEWLLALGLTPDGMDIVADDPITGRVVELSYDPSTRTIGGINGVFDPKTRSFLPLADNTVNMPNGGNGLFVLKNFAPTAYVAVGVQVTVAVR